MPVGMNDSLHPELRHRAHAFRLRHIPAARIAAAVSRSPASPPRKRDKQYRGAQYPTIRSGARRDNFECHAAAHRMSRNGETLWSTGERNPAIFRSSRSVHSQRRGPWWISQTLVPGASTHRHRRRVPEEVEEAWARGYDGVNSFLDGLFHYRRAVGVERFDRLEAPGLALLAFGLGPANRLPVRRQESGALRRWRLRRDCRPARTRTRRKSAGWRACADRSRCRRHSQGKCRRRSTPLRGC